MKFCLIKISLVKLSSLSIVAIIAVVTSLTSGNLIANENGNKNSIEKISSALAQYALDKRQLILFAPSNDNKEYQLFKKHQTDFTEGFKDRKLQTWFVIGDNTIMLNASPQKDLNSSDFRDRYQVDKNEFRLLLIGYDQGEKLRLEQANIKLIFSRVDQMPMRLLDI